MYTHLHTIYTVCVRRKKGGGGGGGGRQASDPWTALFRAG